MAKHYVSEQYVPKTKNTNRKQRLRHGIIKNGNTEGTQHTTRNSTDQQQHKEIKETPYYSDIQQKSAQH